MKENRKIFTTYDNTFPHLHDKVEIYNDDTLISLSPFAYDIAKVGCFSYTSYGIDKIFREYCL